MKKIAITSIAPGHKNFNNQFDAVQSWINNGYHVISMNHPSEIMGLLGQFKNVEFVTTTRTNEKIFKKPYVIVSAILDYLKTRNEEKFLLINSDIIIHDTWKLESELYKKADESIIVMRRYNFDDEMKFGVKFEGGFDAFLIDAKFLDIFPQTILCLGQCFWDYWLPYQCVLNKVPIFEHEKAYIFHKNHPAQYKDEDHEKTAFLFRSEVGTIDKTIKQNMTRSQLSQHVYYKIIEKLKA